MIRNAARRDPTQTTLLRRQFVADTNARIRLLQRGTVTSPTQIRRTIASYESYWSRYTREAYRKGAEQAWSLANKSIPKDEFGILKKDFMRRMEQEISQEGDALGRRVFAEMEGVAQNVSTRVARAISDGRTKGYSRRKIQEMVKEAIGYGRAAANRVVHTEITRAFANGQLSAFEDLGLDYLEIEVEWIGSGLGTTPKGNPSPCPKCSKYVGRRFTLKKAMGLIPFHPFCMCRFVPVFHL